jgi:hypothetical protein
MTKDNAASSRKRNPNAKEGETIRAERYEYDTQKTDEHLLSSVSSLTVQQGMQPIGVGTLVTPLFQAPGTDDRWWAISVPQCGCTLGSLTRTCQATGKQSPRTSLAN